MMAAAAWARDVLSMAPPGIRGIGFHHLRRKGRRMHAASGRRRGVWKGVEPIPLDKGCVGTGRRCQSRENPGTIRYSRMKAVESVYADVLPRGNPTHSI